MLAAAPQRGLAEPGRASCCGGVRAALLFLGFPPTAWPALNRVPGCLHRDTHWGDWVWRALGGRGADRSPWLRAGPAHSWPLISRRCSAVRGRSLPPRRFPLPHSLSLAPSIDRNLQDREGSGLDFLRRGGNPRENAEPPGCQGVQGCALADRKDGVFRQKVRVSFLVCWGPV